MRMPVKKNKTAKNNITNIRTNCTCNDAFSSNMKTSHDTCVGTWPPYQNSKEYSRACQMKCHKEYPDYNPENYSYYNCSCSQQINDTYTTKAYDISSPLDADYVIGIVEFLGANYDSTGSQYNYRLYNTDTIKIGDYVLCESSMGYRIGILVNASAEYGDYFIDGNLIKRSIVSRLPECDYYINRKLDQRCAEDVL